MADTRQCSRCGGELPPGSMTSVCRRCLLRQGIDAGLLGEPPPDAPEMLSISELAAYTTRELAGRYANQREDARGGMGRILLAQDAQLGREVVLKELLARAEPHAAGGPSPSPSSSTPSSVRFVREARITAQLEHPSVVPVYELGEREDGTLFYTMKRVRGVCLSEALGEARDLQDRFRYLPHFLDLCQAVAYAHSRGVIHRDIKPGNVMVGEFGETVLLDWGLAKVRGHEDLRVTPECNTGPKGMASDGGGGQVVGTPSFMSPEQARGDVGRVDERCDVYALGAVLYVILTGKSPFTGGSRSEIVRKVAAGAYVPVPTLAPTAPPELVSICEKAMATAPAERYASARELAQEMERFLTGALVGAHQYDVAALVRRFVARHRAPLLTGLVAAVLLVVLGIAAVLGVLRERDQALEAQARAEREAYYRTIALADSRIGRGDVAGVVPMLEACPERLRGWEWGYLLGLCRLEERQVHLLDEGIRCAALTTDGGRLVVAGASGTLALYETGTLETRWCITTEEAANCLAIAPSGNCVAVGMNHALRLFDLDSGQVLSTPRERPPGSRPWLNHVHLAFTKDGEQLLASGPVISVYRTADWQLKRVVAPGRLGIPPAAWSGISRLVAVDVDDQRMAVTAREVTGVGEVWLVDKDSGEVAWATPRAEGNEALWPYAVSVTADVAGRELVCSESGETEVWRVGEQQPRLHFTADCGVSVLAADGARILTGTPDGYLREYDLATGQQQLWGHCEGSVCAVAYLDDGARMLAVTREGDVTVWQRAVLAARDVPVTLNPQEFAESLRPYFSASGNTIALTGFPFGWTLWDAAELRQVNTLGHPGNGCWLQGFRPGTEEAVLSSYNALRLFSTTDDETTLLLDAPTIVCDVSFDSAGRYMAFAYYEANDPAVEVVDLHTGARQALDLAEVECNLAMSPSGDCLAVADIYDGTVTLWQVPSCRPLGTVRPSGGIVGDIAFHPEDPLLVVGRADGGLEVWDTQRRVMLHGWQGHRHEVRQVAFHPDGNRLLSCGFDRTTRLWDWQTGQELLRLSDTGFRGADFSPDGQVLITSGEPAEVRVTWPASASVHARAAERTQCLACLAQLDEAKLTWATDHDAHPGDPAPELSSLLTARQVSVCPAGGHYSANPVGLFATCSEHGPPPQDLRALAGRLDELKATDPTRFALVAARFLSMLPPDASRLNALAWDWVTSEELEGYTWGWVDSEHPFLAVAILVAEEALRRSPGNGSYLDTLAHAELRAGYAGDAVVHFREAIHAGCNSQAGLACALLARGDGGDLDEVCVLLGPLAATDPDEPVVARALLQLRQVAPGRYENLLTGAVAATAP